MATGACAAGLICLLVYLGTLGSDFVSYDDPDYVLNNPLIRQLDAHLFVSAFSESFNGHVEFNPRKSSWLSQRHEEHKEIKVF